MGDPGSAVWRRHRIALPGRNRENWPHRRLCASPARSAKLAHLYHAELGAWSVGAGHRRTGCLGCRVLQERGQCDLTPRSTPDPLRLAQSRLTPPASAVGVNSNIGPHNDDHQRSYLFLPRHEGARVGVVSGSLGVRRVVRAPTKAHTGTASWNRSERCQHCESHAS